HQQRRLEYARAPEPEPVERQAPPQEIASTQPTQQQQVEFEDISLDELKRREANRNRKSEQDKYLKKLRTSVADRENNLVEYEQQDLPAAQTKTAEADAALAAAERNLEERRAQGKRTKNAQRDVDDARQR